MATDLDRAAQAVVRAYSFEVDDRIPAGHPARPLGQVLAQDREDLSRLIQPWRCFYETTSSLENQKATVTKAVAVEALKLREKWVVFHSNCSQEDRLDLQAFEPTMEGVTATIEQAMATWNKKRQKGWRGKAAANFHKICGTLNSHSNVIAILPEKSEYTSIFAGSLSAIIQASVNHEKIVDGLSKALCTIGEYVRDCTAELDLYPTDKMRELISDLYAHIFLFLNSVMDWIMQKKRRRLLDSFNQDFNSRFEDDIETIAHQADRIRQLAAQASRAEGRVSRLIVEDTGQQLQALRRDIRCGLEAIAREHAEMVYRDRLREQEAADARRERLDLGRRTELLAGWLTKMLQRESQGMHTPVPQHILASPIPNAALTTSLEELRWTAEQVAFESRSMEDFFHRDRIRLSFGDMEPARVPRKLLNRVTEWASQDIRECSILWLKGDATRAEDFENPLSALSLQLIHLLSLAKIPCISYFCELRRDDRVLAGNNSMEVQASICLGYALIRQMVELLPPQFSAKADLSENRFTRLDGTLHSWDELLSIFADLGPLIPSTVYFIIDGFHWLDDMSTEGMLGGLISCLRKHGNGFCVLFTTSGRSSVLLDSTYVEELEEVHNDSLERDGLMLDTDMLLSGT